MQTVLFGDMMNVGKRPVIDDDDDIEAGTISSMFAPLWHEAPSAVNEIPVTHTTNIT